MKRVLSHGSALRIITPTDRSPKSNFLLQLELEGQAVLPTPDPKRARELLVLGWWKCSKRALLCCVSAWGHSRPWPASPDSRSLPKTCCFGTSWLPLVPWEDTSLSRFPFGPCSLGGGLLISWCGVLYKDAFLLGHQRTNLTGVHTEPWPSLKFILVERNAFF